MAKSVFAKVTAALCLVGMLVSLVCISTVSEAKSPIVTKKDLVVIETKFKADGVGNSGGYGNVVTGTFFNDIFTPDKVALINRSGKVIFPFRKTWNYGYTVNGKYISFAPPFANYLIGSLEYYKMENGVVKKIETPLDSGVAMNEEGVAAGYSAPQTESNRYDLTGYLIRSTGDSFYTFPKSFSVYNGLGFGNRTTILGTKLKIGTPNEGLIPIGVENKQGTAFLSHYYMDYQGKCKLKFSASEYEQMGPFVNGLAIVTKNGKKGFIDKTGKLVIPCKYDSASPFYEDIAVVQKKGKYGYIEKSGKTVIPFEYEEAYDGGNGLAMVRGNNKKYGLINYKNQVVVPFAYDDMSSFSHGVAYAVKNRTVYIIKLKDYVEPEPVPDYVPQSEIRKTWNTVSQVKSGVKISAGAAAKKGAFFKIGGKAKEDAKLTYQLSSVPKNAKKYIKVSKNGNVVIKKGIKRGAYKIKVKITAAETKDYKMTPVMKTILIVIR